MAPLVDLVSTNPLISAFVAGVLAIGFVGLINGLAAAKKAKRDGDRIHEFMCESAEVTEHTYRSATAIGSALGMSPTRVSQVCIGDRRFKRNALERESWKLA